MSRLFRSMGLLLAIALLTPTARALPNNREALLRTQIERLAPFEHDFIAKAAYAGHYGLDQLVHFSNDKGRVYATFRLPAELVRQFRDPAPLLISLDGSRHVWSLHRRQSGTLDRGRSMITLTCYAPDQAGPFNRFSLSSDGQSVLLAAGQMFGLVATQESISMNQGEQATHFAWRLAPDRWTPRTVEMGSLNEFASRAPGVFTDYLLPVLRRLGAARPPSDVYRVFDQIPADPTVARQVLPLVRRLGSDNAAARDEAASSLREMGAPAVLACLRLDAATLSPEQINRLAALYGSSGWVHVSDIEAARRDPEFLESCEEDGDPAVRTAASNLLAAIRASRLLR